jgi:lysine 2,3-aminomutase
MEDSFFLEKLTESLEEDVEPPSSPVCTRTPRLNLVCQVRPSAHQVSPDPKDGRDPRSKRHGGGNRFLISSRSNNFRQRFFPAANILDWNDWRWQLQHRIQKLDELARIIELSDDERTSISNHKGHLPLAITPYYASLLESEDPSQPLRRTVVPVTAEFCRIKGEAEDPLGEEDDTPVPGVVHRYPDRALLLVTGFCSTYCRYCTRSRMVGNTDEYRFNEKRWEEAIAYIQKTPTVRDVLLSGGDPLTLTDRRLEWILARLRKIAHVEFLRIGTKVPAVLPHRITPALTQMFRRYHPLWVSIHFTHPDELTPEVAQACNRLADAGIPLGSQTVLLAGVNDEIETMRRLVHGLLKMRVRPYYLYQCDPIPGSSHFRTLVEKGIEIIQGLRGFTTGYAVPTYVIDSPGGGGKIPLLPEHVVGKEGDDLLLRNYQGKIFRYPDPAGKIGL